MSKRYGRNQKRAHRSRIAELERHVAELQKRGDQLWRANRSLVEEIDCAKRIVGEYCVAFEPKTLTMSFKATDYATIIQYERDNNVGVHRYLDAPSLMRDTVSVSQIRLPIMCVMAGEEIRGARHVIVSYDGKSYGYAIDGFAWRHSRYTRGIAERAAGLLTQHIYEEVKKSFPTQEPRRAHTRDEREPRVRQPNFHFNPLPDFLR